MLVLASHLGRPKGKPDSKYSMKPVAAKLAELLSMPVDFAADCVGAEAEAKSRALSNGGVLLLENVRYHAEEEANDENFSRQLAALCDGRGPLRVAVGLLAPEITRDRAKVTLRLAQTGDRDLILTWQQFPGSRRFAHNPQPPTAAEHTQWFARTLDDPSRMLFIVQFEGKPAGMLRLDRESLNQFKISILTAPERYRRGIGAAALALARRLLVRAELHAEVLPANEASRALFRNAGYREQSAGLFVNSYSEAMAST